MPNTGLPKVIQDLITALLDSHDVRTWNIFHDNNSEVTVGLKFSSRHIECESSLPMSPMVENNTVSFKRKTPNQIARDKARSQRRRSQYNSCGYINCSTQTQEPESYIENVRKREQNDSPCLKSKPCLLYTSPSPRD